MASVMRVVQVSVLCPDVRKMRISVDGIARQNLAYRFTDSGAMKIEFKDGRVDGNPVQLAAVEYWRGSRSGEALLRVTALKAGKKRRQRR